MHSLTNFFANLAIMTYLNFSRKAGHVSSSRRVWYVCRELFCRYQLFWCSEMLLQRMWSYLYGTRGRCVHLRVLKFKCNSSSIFFFFTGHIIRITVKYNFIEINFLFEMTTFSYVELNIVKGHKDLKWVLELTMGIIRAVKIVHRYMNIRMKI